MNWKKTAELFKFTAAHSLSFEGIVGILLGTITLLLHEIGWLIKSLEILQLVSLHC